MIACDCDVPKPILEFQSSNYVFEGKVISKTYSSDSLYFTVTFEIFKHYKEGETPKNLKFTFKSESEFTGEWTSCDWSVEKDETWLVYAKNRNEKLTFGYFCSNSKPIGKKEIPIRERKILDQANQFDINNYIFTSIDGHFTNSKPKIELDSLLERYSHKQYGKSYSENRVDIVVDIDENGNLLAANLTSKEHFKIEFSEASDSIYNLDKPKNIKIRKPETEFEKDMLEVASKLRKWDITYLSQTKTPVRIRKFLQFYKKSNDIEVYF